LPTLAEELENDDGATLLEPAWGCFAEPSQAA
jgi:hypothetical protein